MNENDIEISGTAAASWRATSEDDDLMLRYGMKSAGEFILEVQRMLRSISDPPSTRFINWEDKQVTGVNLNSTKKKNTHICKAIAIAAWQLKASKKCLNIRMICLCGPNYCSVEHFTCKKVMCSLISGSN